MGRGGRGDHVLGLVLAGGENARMGGRFKGDLLAGGERFVTHSARVLADAGAGRLLLSLHQGQELSLEGIDVPMEVVCDREEGLGPLAGLLAAADWAEGHMGGASGPDLLLMVCPCDTPLVTAGLYRALRTALRKGDVGALPVLDGHPYPLNAVYRLGPTLTVRLRAARAAGTHGVSRSLEGLPLHRCDLSGNEDMACALTNVNTPGELARLGVG